MLSINRCNLKTVYDEYIDLKTRLYDVEMELQFPLKLLGNQVRYVLSTERRELKHKINKLKESL